jgi:hypothetical protein
MGSAMTPKSPAAAASSTDDMALRRASVVPFARDTRSSTCFAQKFFRRNDQQLGESPSSADSWRVKFTH